MGVVAARHCGLMGSVAGFLPFASHLGGAAGSGLEC